MFKVPSIFKSNLLASLIASMLFAALSITACNNKGLVAITGVQEVSMPTCTYWQNDTFIINDAETFATLFVDTNQCNTTPIPNINFATHTLLAKLTQVSACFATYNRAVYADTDTKEYIYRISINRNGEDSCDSMHVSYNWLSIPKVPDNYNLLFEVLVQ